MLHRVLWHYLEAMRSYRFSQEELKKLQDRRLRHMIHHAYNNVPLYHGWFKSRGLIPEDIRRVEDLRLLPTLSRQEIRENYPHGITASNRSITRGVRIRNTSGTTGPPLTSLQDARCRDIFTALKLRRCRRMNIGFTDKVAWIYYAGPTTSSQQSSNRHFRSLARLYNIVFDTMGGMLPTLRYKAFGIRSHVKDVAEGILKFKPIVMYSRGSFLRRLGYFLDDRRPSVEKVICGSEFLSEGCGKDLARLYHAEIYQTYGANEVGPLSTDCVKHSGMHLESDYFIFEVLRDGEPASPGEPGEAVVTSLCNETMPIIRYDIGDTVVLDAQDRCECGSYLSRLREIQGRRGDGLISKDKIRIPSGVIVDYMESVIGLRDYQLIQKNQHDVLVKLKPQFDTPALRESLSVYLRNLLNQELTIDVETWDDDQMVAKYRPVISKIRESE